MALESTESVAEGLHPRRIASDDLAIGFAAARQEAAGKPRNENPSIQHGARYHGRKTVSSTSYDR